MKRAILFLLLLAIPLAAAQTPSETLTEYYRAFAAEDVDAYVATLAWADDARVTHIKNTFNALDTQTYELHMYGETIDGDHALVEHGITATIAEGSDSFTYGMEYTAFMINDDGWKVDTVIPSSLVEYNAKLLQEMEENPPVFEELPIDETLQEETLPDEPYDAPPEPDAPPENTPVKEEDLECSYDKTELTIESLDVSGVPGLFLVGDGLLQVVVDEQTYWYELKEKVLSSSSEGEPKFIATLDSCTLEKILLGASPLQLYNDDKIVLRGTSVGTSIVTGVTNVVSTIIGWFSSPPESVWVEAETGALNNGGRYSFIGKSGRGPGEAYLAQAGASASYQVDSPKAFTGTLSVFVSDDAKHASNTRSAVIRVNGNKIRYNHVSANTLEGTPWEKQEVGSVTLKKGLNTIIFTKERTTSAAFVMDKFVIEE